MSVCVCVCVCLCVSVCVCVCVTYRMGVADSGDILAGSAVLHGQSSLIDHLSCPLQDDTQTAAVLSNMSADLIELLYQSVVEFRVKHVRINMRES